MKYKEFKNQFYEALLRHLREHDTQWHVLRQEVRRINEVVDALIVLNKEGHSPVKISRVFYVPDLYCIYRTNVDVEDILSSVLHLIEVTFEKTDLGEEFLCFEKCRKKITVSLIGRKGNEILLEHMCCRDFLDMVQIYRLQMPSKDGWTTNVFITEELLDVWGISAEELHQIAVENLRRYNCFRTYDVDDVIDYVSGNSCFPLMYVMTNMRNEYGAAGILLPEVMKEAAELLGVPFYIIPSSIHEVLLVPKVPGMRDNLKEAIISANRQIVPPDEWLSDSLYSYDRDRSLIQIEA